MSTPCGTIYRLRALVRAYPNRSRHRRRDDLADEHRPSDLTAHAALDLQRELAPVADDLVAAGDNVVLDGEL